MTIKLNFILNIANEPGCGEVHYVLHPNSAELFLLLRKSDVTHETRGGERHSEGECDVIEMVTLARGGFQEKILLVRARHLVVVFQLLRH